MHLSAASPCSWQKGYLNAKPTLPSPQREPLSQLSTKNLDFDSLLQLDGSHRNREPPNLSRETRVRSPFVGRAKGEIDVEQESSASRFLFCCISHLSTSVRPIQRKFFG